MKTLLLDTHVVIWWLVAPKRLNRQVYARIERSDVCVSVISIWEMLLKLEHGKLKLPTDQLQPLLLDQGFRVLPLQAEHVRAAAQLLARHPDPHDRLIVGTAHAEGMVLVTRDGSTIERAKPILGDLLLEA